MDMCVTAEIARFPHIDPSPQAESQGFASALGHIDLSLKGESFETTPQLDHQTTGAGVQCEGSVHVTSAFSQIHDVRMFALNFEWLPFSISKKKRGCCGPASFIIQDAPFQPIQAQAPVGQQEKSREHRNHNHSMNRTL